MPDTIFFRPPNIDHLFHSRFSYILIDTTLTTDLSRQPFAVTIEDSVYALCSISAEHTNSLVCHLKKIRINDIP